MRLRQQGGRIYPMKRSAPAPSVPSSRLQDGCIRTKRRSHSNALSWDKNTSCSNLCTSRRRRGQLAEPSISLHAESLRSAMRHAYGHAGVYPLADTADQACMTHSNQVASCRLLRDPEAVLKVLHHIPSTASSAIMKAGLSKSYAESSHLAGSCNHCSLRRTHYEIWEYC